MGEKKKHFRAIAACCYAVFFAFYLYIGFQPADAIHYDISGHLEIPSLSISSDVTTLEIKDNKLATPDSIVGVYSPHKNKTFLIGHSTTIFKGLTDIKTGQIINYNGKLYTVTDITTKAKSDINMAQILQNEPRPTLILMTCAGELLPNADATHRLIVTAENIE